MKFKKITAILILMTASSALFGTAYISAKGDESEISKIEDSQVPEGMPPEGMPPEGPGGPGSHGNSNVDTTGVKLVDGSAETISNEEIVSTGDNESTIKVTNKGSLTLKDSVLNKTSGATASEEESDFFGANSGILVNEGSTAYIENTKILTSTKGGNAVFATGEGSQISLKNVSIYTTSNNSRGLDATYGGKIDAENIRIETKGAHCAALATDRGEGTITVKNATLNTSGEGSPCVYSTGDIKVSSSSGLASGSAVAVVEGKNSIELNECDLTGYGIGRATGGIDNTGIMIYQSMSGDAGIGIGKFTANNSNLSISKDSPKYAVSPMLFVTNTNAEINLNNTRLSFGSGILLNVAGNSGEWGKAGSNGGNLTLNAANQTLEGKITVDEISTLILNLNSSVLLSEVNSANTAKEIKLTLDKNSTWNVQGTSYITSITDEETSLNNIKDNGNTIYYDSSNSDNSWLDGKTITLQDGGKLTPQ